MQEINIPLNVLIGQVLQVIREGHTATIRLTGYSMRPFLEHKRDKALLGQVTRLEVGMPVLALLPNGHYVLHRIIAIHGDQVTLMGDGNLTTEHCSTTDVKAQALGFYRKGRHTLDPVTGRKWRIYSAVWMHLRPIRRYLLFIYRHFFI